MKDNILNDVYLGEEYAYLRPTYVGEIHMMLKYF